MSEIYQSLKFCIQQKDIQHLKIAKILIDVAIREIQIQEEAEKIKNAEQNKTSYTKEDKEKRIRENLKEYIGKTYNKLKIIEIGKIDLLNSYDSEVICQCECGNTLSTRLRYVIYGYKKSCGCDIETKNKKKLKT